MSGALVLLAIVSTGLYAGYMLAFSTGVMPALGELDDAQFTSAMRMVNRKVPRALFLLLLVGSVALPTVSLVLRPDGRESDEQLMVAAAAVCALVGHLITIAGNVPLNNALEGSRDSTDQHAARTAFESRWNRLHTVRTLFAVLAFVLMTLSVV